MSEAKTAFRSWAIVELMGHVRVAGLVSEEERFGSKLGRVDVPDDAGGFTTQYFGGGSVYRLTPCTEEIARAVAKQSQPEPVYAWDLRRQLGITAAKQPAHDPMGYSPDSREYDDPDDTPEFEPRE